MPAPLDGLRVIDAANWLAAPAAAGLMADMGADVIKIEPPAGDSYRALLRTNDPESPVLPGWENDNRGKRGVALDLDQPEGREILLRLCESADVLISNFTPQRAQRHGLTFEAVRARNPHIVHATLTGYGSRGAEANRIATDSAAFWARSGIQSLIGDDGTPSVLCLVGQGDHTTSLCLLSAVLAALRVRDQTGEAQCVEVSLEHTGLWTISNQAQAALMHRPPETRPNRLRPRNPISNTYLTRDGRWVSLRMSVLHRDWPRFCAVVDHLDWLAEFPDFAAVTGNSAVLRERIDALCAQHDLAYWRDLLDGADLLWAPVSTLEEVIVEPQLREMEAFQAVEHPIAGTIEMVAAPFKIAGTDIRVRRPAPTIGEHTFEVLTEAGFSSEELAGYAEHRVFG